MFSPRCTPLQMLGVSVDRHSQRVAENRAVLQQKRFQAVLIFEVAVTKKERPPMRRPLRFLLDALPSQGLSA